MSGASETRSGLLRRVRRAEDGPAWAEFLEIYTPSVYGYCRRYGLQDADAHDVTQDVFEAVAKALPGFSYDRRQGLFRHYMLKVTRSKLHDFRRRQSRQPRPCSGAAMAEMPAQPAPDDTADQRRDDQRQLLARTQEKVRSKFREATWQAFWQTAMQGLPAKDVAERLGTTTRAVYIAKSRVLKCFREQIKEMRFRSE